jgi:hypothetical protein
MINLGEVALWMSLPVAAWGMVLGYAGGRTQRGDLVLSAERSIYAVFGLLTLASAGIVAAFVGDRFEYWYVSNYSNADLEIFYKITGLWAGQRGSLLFWALILGFFSCIAMYSNRRKNREFMPYVAGVLQTILLFFIVVLLFADVNPFERLQINGIEFTPADGQGLNHDPIRICCRVVAQRPTRCTLDSADASLDSHQLAISVRGNRIRNALGVRRAGVGWLLVLGSGRERLASPMADGYCVSAFGSNSRKPGHVEGLEHVPGPDDFPAYDFCHVPDKVRTH